MEGSVIKRKINIFLLFIPVVLFHEQLFELMRQQSEAVFGTSLPSIDGFLVFALAALSLIPLAGFVESAVEELAELLGPFIGGLLHTTFGNVAELTIGISLLLYTTNGAEIVLSSIAGVIIRNSLFFLGLSTVLGCFRNGHMKFDAENASEYSTVFALAVVGLCLPTIAKLLGSNDTASLFNRVPLNGYVAIVLITSYLAYIGFAVFRIQEGYNLVEVRNKRRAERIAAKQRKRLERQQRRGFALPVQPDTQALFSEEREQAELRLEGMDINRASVAASSGHPSVTESKRIYAKGALLEHKRQMREQRGEHGFLAGHRVWRGVIAAIVLAAATAGVASMSEEFAKSVEAVISANPVLGHYEFFLGLILIPVLAGIVEFYGSIDAARNNRMEITMAVTAGASIQMILLIVPILVLVGQFSGHPLSLVFQPFEIIIFAAATFVFMLLSRDGESTWLEGAQLCTLWLLIAATTLFVQPAG